MNSQGVAVRPPWMNEESDVQHFSTESSPSVKVLSSATMTGSMPATTILRPPLNEMNDEQAASQTCSSKHRKNRVNTKQCQRMWLALLASICFGWAVWLILLTVAPNETVNRVMKTESFDDGTFWLLVDTPSSFLWPTVIGLAVVALGNLATIFQMITRSSRQLQVVSTIQSTESFNSIKVKARQSVDEASSKIKSSVARSVVTLAEPESSTRQLVNTLLKFGDLTVEAFLLFQTLESGAPVPLVIIFTIIIAANALSCVAIMFYPYELTGITTILIDLWFDFLVAVGYPILVLIYCFSTFNFDYAKYGINLEVFPATGFERSASVIADPVQTNVIHKTLTLLRVASELEVFTRVGVNLIFCFRLYRVAKLIQTSEQTQGLVYPKRKRIIGTLLVGFVILLIVFVEESVRTSTRACRPHPECVVKAHRWTLLKNDSLDQCPCIAFIDADIAPKMFYEWVQPRNVTEKLAQLAATGDLQTIQLINRYLPALPDELRRCTKMAHISLVYTHTATMPEWIQEYTHLEYLHVEGIFFASLLSLPDRMFDKMSSLTFLHLGFHPILSTLPSFDGLTSLKSLTVAMLFSLVELPSFQNLHNLERLVIVSLVNVNSLPDLTPVKKFTLFAVADRAPWCCNGFLGSCDLQNPNCQVHPLWGTPAATCLPSNRTEDRPSDVTLDVLKKFSYTICNLMLLPGEVDVPPTEDSMRQCNGTLYRQCDVPGQKEAMCYGARLMGICCSANPYVIEMRRRQIQRGIGDRCDPEFEAWLGCQ